MIEDPGAGARADVGQDGSVLGAEVTPDTVEAQHELVKRAVGDLIGTVWVLPATELSGFRGYPLIRWSEALGDRLAHGAGPVLDRPTLARWESAARIDCTPSAPLQILGFVSTSPWRQAIRAARQLRGFGVGCVLTATRPSTIRLSEADYAGVYVIHVDPEGTAEVLVHGVRGDRRAPRMVATRYWEERLLAHALATGSIKLPRPMARFAPTEPESLWEATGRPLPHLR